MKASMKIIQSKDFIFPDKICPPCGSKSLLRTCRPASISHTSHAAKCITVMWLHLAHLITGLLPVRSTHKYILHSQSVSRLQSNIIRHDKTGKPDVKCSAHLFLAVFVCIFRAVRDHTWTIYHHKCDKIFKYGIINKWWLSKIYMHLNY